MCPVTVTSLISLVLSGRLHACHAGRQIPKYAFIHLLIDPLQHSAIRASDMVGLHSRNALRKTVP